MNESNLSSTLSLNKKDKSFIKSAWDSVCSLTRNTPEKEVVFYKLPPSATPSCTSLGCSRSSSQRHISSHCKTNDLCSSEQSLLLNESYPLQNWNPGCVDMSFDEVGEPYVRTSSPAVSKNPLDSIRYSVEVQTDSIPVINIGSQTDGLLLLDKEVDATVLTSVKGTQTDRKKKKWYKLFNLSKS